MAETTRWWVGIDWATVDHQVCVMDAAGREVTQRVVAHTAVAVRGFVDWLRAHVGGDLGTVAVGIETPRGALVATLMEQGLAVSAVNPKQLDRFRDRHTVAGAKDDRRDARVLADSLRTDAAAFHRVEVDDPVLVQLRELVHVEETLQIDVGRLTNRLRDQVHRIQPALLALCPAADAPWFWALWAQAPTIAVQRVLSRAAIGARLKARRIRRVTAAEVHGALQTPALTTAPGVVEATEAHIALLVPHLRLVVAQRTACVKRTAALLRELATREDAGGELSEHRDVQILRSLPGVGRQVAATMLAEASRPLRARDYHTLRLYVGIAPVSKWSGKRRRRPTVHMRRACNRRLRRAAYHWGRVSLVNDGPTRVYYDELRARGHTHGRALRSVIDRWFRILMAMLRTGTLYDSSRVSRRELVKVPA